MILGTNTRVRNQFRPDVPWLKAKEYFTPTVEQTFGMFTERDEVRRGRGGGKEGRKERKKERKIKKEKGRVFYSHCGADVWDVY